MILKYGLISAIGLFLCGCATLYNPATGRNEFILIDSATEVAIGQRVARQLTKSNPVSLDNNLALRVEKVGRRIAAVSDRQDIEYKFRVLENKELNAVSLPGGFIYINKGLINILNDDELAYVLSHEVGHVAARHMAKRMQANIGYQLLLNIAFASVGEGMADTAVDIARGVDTVYKLTQLSYSRKDEYEADRLAVKYAYWAKFNPGAAISALEKIKKEEGANWRLLKYFRTHPYIDERISALKIIIPQLHEKKLP